MGRVDGDGTRGHARGAAAWRQRERTEVRAGGVRADDADQRLGGLAVRHRHQVRGVPAGARRVCRGHLWEVGVERRHAGELSEQQPCRWTGDSVT